MLDKKTINITIPIIFCTIMTLLISFVHKEKILVFDMADYWRRGKSLFQGGFSLYNIPDTFRGYLFSLDLVIAGKLGG